MNRHGISQNPTAEEAALLRKLWAADAAEARAHNARHEAETWKARALAAEQKLAALEGRDPAPSSMTGGVQSEKGPK